MHGGLETDMHKHYKINKVCPESPKVSKSLDMPYFYLKGE
jgi:hypothetical protein